MNESISWAAIIMAAMSLVANVVQQWNARLAKRDKMAFNAQLATVTAELQACKAHHAESQQDLDDLHDRLNEQARQLADARAVVADLQRQVTANKG